jgi:pimeloyl-ACP methyl ester carboxylesterase
VAVIVLVHGALQTAATWDLVVTELTAAGHEAHTPHLTGTEGRSAELTRDVTLDTHIDDVTRYLADADLRDVTLVGHSYSGMVITGVAERAYARLARLVYADALVPDDGQSGMQILPASIQKMFRDLARAEPDGFRIRPSEHFLDVWGLKPGPARDYVRARMSDFSVNCFEQPISLPSRAATALDRTFIAGVAPDYPAKVAFDPFAQRAQAEGWHYHELPAGHEFQAEVPAAFAALLTAPLLATR